MLAHTPQWKYVLQTTTRESYTAEQQRDHVALLLAYATGLRRTTGRHHRRPDAQGAGALEDA
jgi:hypothetical protein